ncbi:hypothetical protein [uncultured Agrobacterium sp.]|uniref:hypothetical protein n=1 Tax=uncultured Agrobacterium sp. TaxID=157277 RepID=UPI0025E7C680|nr:hypothetical protein [uncultured Agrobacterium sp.]
MRLFGAARPARGTTMLWTRSGAAIDLTVSPDALDEGIAAANALFLALEDRGHQVSVAARQGFIRPKIDCRERSGGDPPSLPWAPLWPTIAVVGGVAIGLAFMEIHERAEVQYAGNGRFLPLAATKRKRADKIVGITWQQSQLRPTGRLKVAAYSPFHTVPWQRHFLLEGSGRQQLSSVVLSLEEFAITLSATYREAGFP